MVIILKGSDKAKNLCIPWLEIQLKSKLTYNRDICKPMLTVTQFSITVTWNSHRCQLVDKVIKEIKYMNKMEYSLKE